MLKVLYFFVWISVLISQGKASCEFIPNVSKVCLDFWTFTDMTYGCLNVKDNMKFSGLIKTVDGENLISVNATDMNTGNMITVWVRKADGHCKMDCCSRKKNQRRFIIDSFFPSLQSICKNNCHGHGNCTFGIGIASCNCHKGYSGLHCEKEDPCHDVTCQNGGHCSSGLCSCVNDFTGRHCELMISTTTVTSVQTTQQTTSTVKPCVDEQFINCQDPDICQSPLSDRCPLSCGLCVPITTQMPCADNKFVNCQNHLVCSSKVSHYCPVSCGICGSKSNVQHVQGTTTKASTTTGWLFVTRQQGPRIMSNE